MVDQAQSPVEGADGTYCSPRCGWGCTRAQHDLAVAKGREISERMGAGWEYEVSEKYGWNCRVRRGQVAILVPTRDLDLAVATIRVGTRPFSASARSVGEALRLVVQEAIEFSDELWAVLDDLSELEDETDTGGET